MMVELKTIRRAIRKFHKCESVHTESVHVHEHFQGRTIWEGTVEVFTLLDHPTAKRCYVWSRDHDEGGERFVAVLELPPIDSAQRAVQEAIAAEGKLMPWESSYE